MENNRSILVVDDSPVVIQTIKTILSEYGYENISAASNADEAIKISDEMKFNLVILDFHIPGKNGEFILDHLKHVHPDTMVVMLSGQSEKDTVVRLMRKADDYISKDNMANSKDELIGTITRVFKMQILKEENHSLIRMLSESNAKLRGTIIDLEHTQSRMYQQEKMAAIGQLAAGMAHEINNPLGFVKSNLQTLIKYVENIEGFIEELLRLPEARDRGRNFNIDYIRNELKLIVTDSIEGTDRIGRIVDKMGTLSRIERGPALYDDVNEILDRAVVILRNNLKFSVEVSRAYASIPLISCYPFQLEQAFRNLLLNAIQAVSDRGIIKISSFREGRSIIVTIEDNGCGIKKENIPKVFDPFYTTRDTGEGAGMGLTIAYDIIRAHHGTIAVESEEGIGTVFTITLQVETGSDNQV